MVLATSFASNLSVIELIVIIIGGILTALGLVWSGIQFRKGSIGKNVIAIQEANTKALQTQNDLQALQIEKLENTVKEQASRITMLTDLVQSRAAVEALGQRIDAYFKEMGVKLPNGQP